MISDIPRRRVLQTLALLGLAAPIRSLADEPPPVASSPRSPTLPHFPSQDPALVRETVGASHFDLDRVRELVEKRPALAKASWDWGYGDWESPLGAASHTGQREIAELLIAKGARPSIFSAAMLGQLAVVRAFAEASPGVQRIPGPHGIPLLAHAEVGGESAKAVVEYLASLGDADRRATPATLAEDAARSAILGKYSFGPSEEDVLEIREGKKGLEIARGSRSARMFAVAGPWTFHPAGAPDVHIEFQVENGSCRALVVHDPDPIVQATRLGA